MNKSMLFNSLVAVSLIGATLLFSACNKVKVDEPQFNPNLKRVNNIEVGKTYRALGIIETATKEFCKLNGLILVHGFQDATKALVTIKGKYNQENSCNDEARWIKTYELEKLVNGGFKTAKKEQKLADSELDSLDKPIEMKKAIRDLIYGDESVKGFKQFKELKYMTDIRLEGPLVLTGLTEKDEITECHAETGDLLEIDGRIEDKILVGIVTKKNKDYCPMWAHYVTDVNKLPKYKVLGMPSPQ
jgi:hypothetical protein